MSAGWKGMTRFVLDAYAWIEYFSASEKGKKAAEIIENESHQIFTSSATLAEIVSKVLRESRNAQVALNFIYNLSTVMPVTREIAVQAGRIHFETKKKNRDFGMLDAFVAATAQTLKAKILTGDEDFRHFREVVFI